MIVMSKEEEALPSYNTALDGFSYSPDKKEYPPQPAETPASSAPPYPSTSSNTTYYAPAPAPFSHSAALTASNSTTITPLSFSRPRAQGPEFTYALFKPIFLFASSDKSTSLSKGFPMTPPPSKDDPHPFATHDITEIDWLQFMNDVHTAGSLTEKDIQRSHIPILSWVPIVGGLSVYGVQKFMKSRKSSTVAKTVDTWNHHFFETRKIRIVLMRGNERLSGSHERTMGDLHSLEPVKVSSGILENATGNGKGKGKSKEEVDEVYRLFVLSI